MNTCDLNREKRRNTFVSTQQVKFDLKLIRVVEKSALNLVRL